MSDTIWAAIIGGTVAIIAAIITGFISYRVGKDQSRTALNIAKQQQERERKATEYNWKRRLNDNILDQLSSVLISFPIEHIHDTDHFKRELIDLEEKSQTAIKRLWLEGHQQEMVDQLDDIVKDYFRMLKQYLSGDNHVTEQQIEACRQTTKLQVSKILRNFRHSSD